MTRLELADGQWIGVREGLKVRDKRDVHAYSVDGVSADGQTYRFNVVKHQIASAAVRIVSWGLKDEKGKPIQWPAGTPTKEKITVIENLDEDIFDAITSALDVHDKAQAAALVAEKNETPAGETDSATILSSAAV